MVMAGLCVGAYFGYLSYARHRDLQETLQWMEQTYNPHEGGSNYGRGHGIETHYLENTDTHTEETTQEFHETIIPRSGCTIVLHEETVPIGLHKDVHWQSDVTLSLCDIDPQSITIQKYDPHKDVFSCSDPEEVALYKLNCTSAEVVFHTRNDEPKIQDNSITIFEKLTGSDHLADDHRHVNMQWFIVDDVTYAERLVKALRHAIELCGGQTSKF